MTTSQYYPATKARYIPQDKLIDEGKWDQESTEVMWTKEMVGKGGMRDCYRVFEKQKDGTVVEMIGKIFQESVKATRQDYESEAITQTVADLFAQEYNRHGLKEKISFLACYVVEIHCQSNGPVIITMEPMLKERTYKYQKHNNNAGHVFTNDPTAEAFSHFTYETSNRKMVVCDLQGVGGMYTDPQIHSIDEEKFGLGNLGARGIASFVDSHKCSPICAALDLPPVKGDPRPSINISPAHAMFQSVVYGRRHPVPEVQPYRPHRGPRQHPSPPRHDLRAKYPVPAGRHVDDGGIDKAIQQSLKDEERRKKDQEEEERRVQAAIEASLSAI